MIAAAVETSRPLIDAAKHELTVTLPPRPLVVEGDAMRLAQVFSNLLNNAVKYTDAGGRISIVARLEGDSAVVTVTDTGSAFHPRRCPTYSTVRPGRCADSRAQTEIRHRADNRAQLSRCTAAASRHTV